ncbi:MAG: GNAT family N-acetyltransferase [Phototrophicaceae bacterium]|jgi:RimJ/RimL family protein N-acetyltransferase
MTHSIEIHTARLHLRGWQRSDIPNMVQRINDPDIGANTLQVPYPYSLKDAERFFERLEEGNSGALSFAVIRHRDGELIAGAGIHPPALEHHRADVGYWVASDFRGQGYATELLGGLLEYGFAQLGMYRMYATYFPHNPASRRVMEKNGMQFEGILRAYYFKHGEPQDVGICAILRHEWQARQR